MPTQAALEQAAREAWPNANDWALPVLIDHELENPFTLALARNIEAEQVDEAMVEDLAKAYAKATGYYVQFHKGLSSPSSDKIRTGIRAIHAALAAVKPDDGWQPIETAPKDGSEALVGCWVVKHEEDDGPDFDPYFAQWVTIFDGGPLGNEGFYGGEPTHWSPLPAPPARKEG